MKQLKYLTLFFKYVGVFALTFLMVFITIGVLSRLLFTPIIGDIEIVELGMIVIIMYGLMYSESIDGHISIGLIVDQLSEKTQHYLTIIAKLFTGIVALIIAYVFFNLAVEHMTTNKLMTSLLRIPYYPFDFSIFLGFLGWGLLSISKMIEKIIVGAVNEQ